jgi:hypothetical protein
LAYRSYSKVNKNTNKSATSFKTTEEYFQGREVAVGFYKPEGIERHWEP